MPGVDVASGAGERPEHDALALLHALQQGEHVGGAQVVVVEDEVTARGDDVPQPSDHRDRVGHVEEQQAGVDEIERPVRDRLPALEVDGCERALVVSGAVQHLDRLRAEGRVDVDADDLSGRPDALGQQSHRLPRPAARVQAAGALGELHLVDQTSGGLLPDARLRPQSLVLLVGMSEYVLLLGYGAHRHSLRGRGHRRHARRCRAIAHRGSDHDLWPAKWTPEDSGRTVGPCATCCSIATRSSPRSQIAWSRREPEPAE